jgi:hypothetical protein
MAFFQIGTTNIINDYNNLVGKSREKINDSFREILGTAFAKNEYYPHSIFTDG